MIKVKNNYLLLFYGIFTLNLSSDISLLSVPDGFSIKIYADNISSPRQITEGSEYIFTASGSKGEIYALLDLNNDHVMDRNRIIAKDLFDSRGVTYKDGDLYFAEVDKIWVIRDIEDWLNVSPLMRC